MTKQEFATLVVAMQAMYGEDFIGTEQALDVWYALLHDLLSDFIQGTPTIYAEQVNSSRPLRNCGRFMQS